MWRSGGGAFVALLLVSACGASCFGRGPRPEFFTLSPTAAAPVPAVRPGLGLAIGPLEFPRYLDRPEIVTRDGAHRLVFTNAHRWGGSLRSDVLRVLADDLGTLLGTSHVAVYPTEPPFPVDYRVLLDLREFEAVEGGSVRLRMHWVVASGADGKAQVVQASHVEQPIASPSWGDLVAAHSVALGAVSREIAEKLAALHAKHGTR